MTWHTCTSATTPENRGPIPRPVVPGEPLVVSVNPAVTRPGEAGYPRWREVPCA